MICCYNAARNDPYKESHHPRYTPLHKVPDSAIREAGLKRFAESTVRRGVAGGGGRRECAQSGKGKSLNWLSF